MFSTKAPEIEIRQEEAALRQSATRNNRELSKVTALATSPPSLDIHVEQHFPGGI
jgi:hypothetical protein